MSVWDGTPNVGDRVVSTGSISAGLFSTIPGGCRGKVLDRNTSIISGTTCTVEFRSRIGISNVVRDVPISKLKRVGGPFSSIIKMLTLISMLPILLGLAPFLLGGGSSNDLVGALIDTLTTGILSMLAPLLPLAILIGAIWLVVSGGRKPR